MSFQWADVFQPVVDASQGKVVSREGQAVLGQTWLDLLYGVGGVDSGVAVVEAPVGVGKSFGALVPVIHKVLENRSAGGRRFRAVVATESNSLADQYVDNDLPYLVGVYGRGGGRGSGSGVTYAALKGRNWYLCLNHLRINAVGNPAAQHLFDVLSKSGVCGIDGVGGTLGTGYRSDVSKVLGRDLFDQEWSWMCGDSVGCGEFKCGAGTCFGARARARASEADIVVTNFNLLKIHSETVSRDLNGDGVFGRVDAIVCDEAHVLEDVLIDSESTEISLWDLDEMTGAIEAGMSGNEGAARRSVQVSKNLRKVWDTLRDFHVAMAGRARSTWDGYSAPVQAVYLRSDAGEDLLEKMRAVEGQGMVWIGEALEFLRDAKEYLDGAVGALGSGAGSGSGGVAPRVLRKAATACKDLEKFLGRLVVAVGNDGSYFWEYGRPYTCIISGSVSRKGTRRATLSVVPLDVSDVGARIWAGKKVLLMSGTLAGTDGGFGLVRRALGIGDVGAGRGGVVVPTSFDYARQQRVYVGGGGGVGSGGASFNELVDVLVAARGRSLVLFTSRKEMEETAKGLRLLVSKGLVDWKVYVQGEPHALDRFREDIGSVLLGTRSYFTGVNVVGESLSQVIIWRYPNIRYDALCKAKVEYWRSLGYKEWYQEKALVLFRQMAGRLIRTETDRGVVSVLDRRTSASGKGSGGVREGVARGIRMIGGSVVREISEIKEFLA